jgi:diguanylate cyclase (GGDEF)-like protein
MIKTNALLKMFSSFALPDGLLLLAVVGLLRPTGLPAWTGMFVMICDYLVLGAGMLLGWFVGLSRVMFATLLLVIADGALQVSAQGIAAAGVGRTVFNVVGVLLPLNFLALSLIRERGLAVRRELGWVGLLLVQALLVIWFCFSKQSELTAAGTASLEITFIDPRFTGWTSLSQSSLLAFGSAFVLVTSRFILHRSRLDRGFFWALMAVFIALDGTRLGWSSTNFLAGAGLILIVAIYADEYRLAYYDELTNIRGRPALDEILHNLGSRYAIAIVDIDEMKQVNERYGHSLGNLALQLVAKKIANVSGGGEAFSYDGGKFVVIFRRKSAADVLPHLETLRTAVETSSISLPRRWPGLRTIKAMDQFASKELVVTISIGVAEPTQHLTKPDQVMKAAGQALLRAKQAGRNEVRALV